MIVPWLKGFLSFKNAPVTWTLFVLNIIVFLFFSFTYRGVDSELDELISDQEFLQTQSYVFTQYISKNSERYPAGLSLISKRASEGHLGARHVLSGLALRDLLFLSEGADQDYFGDKIAIDSWKKKFRQFVAIQKQHPGQQWGVSAAAHSLGSGFSYQFVHGGFLHLLTNMYFLLIFGCFLEMFVGSFRFLGLYAFAGLFAAFVFTKVTGLSMAPLIGASGAINGLVGFFAALYIRRSADFAFFLLPKEGYCGKVKFPVWIFIIIWLLSDLGAALGTLPELGGVAHTAHLGGFIFGLVAGNLFVLWGKASAHRILRN